MGTGGRDGVGRIGIGLGSMKLNRQHYADTGDTRDRADTRQCNALVLSMLHGVESCNVHVCAAGETVAARPSHNSGLWPRSAA